MTRTEPSKAAADAQAVDLPRIERAVREMILALGEDPDREGLRKTPARIARAYAELTEGLRIDPRVHLQTVFHEKYNQIVLLRKIPFHTTCEHHFLPFVGHAHVAYLPRHRVVGLSKLARVVEGFALRPQVQERLTDQIADAIMEGLRPLGAICVIDASHTCMTIRGPSKYSFAMTTPQHLLQYRHDSEPRTIGLLESSCSRIYLKPYGCADRVLERAYVRQRTEAPPHSAYFSLSTARLPRM